MAQPNLKVMDEDSLDQSWKLLGAGGFGQVWKAKHLRWGFNVAVKILGLDNGLHSNEDMVKEADFMLRAAECPYVMRAMGVFRGLVPKTGVICVGLVMENMERGSLTSLQVKLQHLPPWPLVFRLTHQVALGMNYLHCLDPVLIHKDLKPDNILLDASLNVKITDFGLAKLCNKVTATRLKNFGTAPFAPPEVSEGGATPAYDVYSYAMVLYSILHTGHIAEFNASRGERPSLEDVKRMKVSGLEELVDLMEKCWDQTPDRRPPFTECISVTEGLPQTGINDAVHQVQNELDGVSVPVVETPSGTNQDIMQSELKELRAMMEKMRVEARNASAELQLQKDKMDEMRVEMTVESRNQKDKTAEMRVEARNQTDKMAEMRVELGNASAELQLQKETVAEMRVEARNQTDKKMAEMRVEMTVLSRSANDELQLQKDKMADLEKENAVLTSRLTAMEETVTPLTPTVADMEQKLEGIIQQARIKELQEKTDAELRRIQQYEVDVTLDPDTAHPDLILSKDRKQVSDSDVRKKLPDNTKRFSYCVNVLGKQGFSSGRFYYEVQVGGKTGWTVGVVRESIVRKGSMTASPNNGFWTIGLRNGNEYWANADPRVLLPVREKVQTVGVFVDYEEGLVSFHDVETRVHLYSFTGCSFTGKLFPFFCPELNDGGKNSAPLIIRPLSKH